MFDLALTRVFGAVCPGCRSRGSWLCPTCAQSAEHPEPCNAPRDLDRLFVGRSYTGVTREATARLKYHNERVVIDWLIDPLVVKIAEALSARSQALSPGLPDPVTITWAPTTKMHRRSRGFDQAELLAAAIARGLKIGLSRRLMRLDNSPQTGKGRAHRRVGPQMLALQPLQGLVIVVDDVVTTGSTLSSAASALRVAGAGEIWGAVAARTEWSNARRQAR
jgi:predicted amidophosphoribosyltransferase